MILKNFHIWFKALILVGTVLNNLIPMQYKVWLWRSRNDFIANVPVYLEGSERGPLQNTPLGQLCTSPIDSATVEHTCTLRGFWEGPPSKYSPWAAVHLAHWFCPCWKHWWNSCYGVTFSAVITFIQMFQYPEIFFSLRQTLCFGNG
jgi:hypothetical protein